MSYVRIKKAANGFVMEYDDPELRERNRKSDSCWIDCEVVRVYNDPEALMKDLPTVLNALEEHEQNDKTALEQAFETATQGA